MEVIPTIEIRGGKVAQRIVGEEGRGIFGVDPLAVALAFAAEGATRLHVVDGDGQRTGRSRNRVAIGAIANGAGIPVMVQAGVADRDSAEALFDAGVNEVVIGHGAVSDPGLVEFLALKHPGQLLIELSALAAGSVNFELIRRFAATAIAGVVFDEAPIRAGYLEAIAEVLAMTDLPVYAAAPVETLEDLDAYAAVRPGGWKLLAGALVGRPLFTGSFGLAEARERFSS